MYVPIAIAALILQAGMQGSGAASESVQSGYLVVYGVKTVTPTLTLEEGRKRGRASGDIPKVHVTRLFSVDPSSGKETLIFSDETLPLMILNRDGGGETALYGIVATDPSRRKAIALAGVRPAAGEGPNPAPSLYELSLDGSNAARKISDVEALVVFAVSRDGEEIAYFRYRPNRVVVRSTRFGKISREINLEGREFAGLPRLSWSPDGSAVLIPRWPGPGHETEYDLAHIPEARIEKTEIRGNVYSFLPKSDRVLGVRLTYDKSNASPLRQFFSMALSGRDAVNLLLPQCRESWHAEVSPDERLIAFPCNQGIVIGALATGDEKKSEREVPVGRAEVIGWIAR